MYLIYRIYQNNNSKIILYIFFPRVKKKKIFFVFHESIDNDFKMVN